MGEFGFVTADFFYLTTVYATDEEGKFHILSRSRKYIGPPTEKPPTRNIATRRPTTVTPPPQQIQVQTEPSKPPTTKKPNGFRGLNGCSNCIVPTTTKTPPINVNVKDDRINFPIIGVNPVRGQGNGREVPSSGRPGNFPPKSPARQKVNQPGSFPRPGAPIDPSSPLRTGQINPGKPISPNRPVSSVNATPQNRPGLGGVNQQRGNQQRGNGQAGLGQSDIVKGDPGGPNYKFNYTVGFHGHHEIGYRGGSKEGGYFANYRNGEGQRVVYEANEFGFQPNVTKVKLNDAETPKEETEKEFGLKGYEFIWFK
ncbi:hypothetical protein J437_LFUL015897 [Ladona fulva]|uniref:Uncharacterized protein n=1 Tax=Ladona fulva TaxID=123851 RepID=A0A8K0KHA3_LADFU|nr:hypothetical protein J437_LFUL015897 [Ladona fulva]